MAAATGSGLWVLVWCFAAVHWYASGCRRSLGSQPWNFTWMCWGNRWLGLAADAVGGAGQEATKIWNELPACILVRFKTKTTWRVQGIDEDNVFPVAPQKKPWYLDKERRRPVLRGTRKQFPLAPGFATTAHKAQGQTCKEGVVMDMHIGDTGDPLTAYIALTVDACPRQAWFVCVQTLPCSTVSKGRKSRAGIAVAVLGW